MTIYFHDDHHLHFPKNEFEGSGIRDYPESPVRVENIISSIQSNGLEHHFEIPRSLDFSYITAVHTQDYVDFLRESSRYLTENQIEEIAPTIFTPFLPTHIENSFSAKLGYYFFDPATPITPGSYQAAISGVNCALSAVMDQQFNRNFALSRPPGHHATRGKGAGYCIFNNVAIAAQYLKDHGKTVSILDLDYHHGNGTQEIFYDTNSVQYVSIHADPTYSYPYYWGSELEKGAEDGLGFNHNLPIPAFSDEKLYLETMKEAIALIVDYSPDTVLVSMGFDCHQDDPVAGMNLTTQFYSKIGKEIAKFDKIAVILEGGYSLPNLGPSFVNLFKGMNE